MSPRSAVAALCLLAMAGSTSWAGKLKHVHTTHLDELYDSSFEGYEPPTPEQIRGTSVWRDYTHVEFREMWDSALRLIIQKGVVLHVSMDSGVLVCVPGPPLVRGQITDTKTRYFIEKGSPTVVLIEPAETGGVRVHANWWEGFYFRNDRPEVQIIGITEESKSKLANEFLDQLAVEMFGRHKWKYLTG